jgi:hypothetical protein
LSGNFFQTLANVCGGAAPAPPPNPFLKKGFWNPKNFDMPKSIKRLSFCGFVRKKAFFVKARPKTAFSAYQSS